MTPLKARQERFGRRFAQWANAAAAAPASTPTRFVYFCFGEKEIDFNAI